MLLQKDYLQNKVGIQWKSSDMLFFFSPPSSDIATDFIIRFHPFNTSYTSGHMLSDNLTSIQEDKE